MSWTKERMVKGMNKIMLSCDEATLLVTKSEFVRLSCNEQVRLKMHLVTCKFCRRFKKQSEMISLQIHKLDLNFDKKELQLHLSEEQKARMIKAIRQKEAKKQ